MQKRKCEVPQKTTQSKQFDRGESTVDGHKPLCYVKLRRPNWHCPEQAVCPSKEAKHLITHHWQTYNCQGEPEIPVR